MGFFAKKAQGRVNIIEPEEIARLVVKPPWREENSRPVKIFFGADYVPGTFFLAERKKKPAFLWDEGGENYEEWIRTMVKSHLNALCRACSRFKIDQDFQTSIEDIVLKVLDSALGPDRVLSEVVTNQQATDIVWRIVKVLLMGDPYASFHICETFNKLGRRYALGVLKRGAPQDSFTAFKYSIVSGALGSDVKALYVAAGPSPIVNTSIIKLFSGIRKPTIGEIGGEMKRRVIKPFPIDQFNEFQKDVLDKTRPITLAFFTDDYIETIFDLWAIQLWLRLNPYLRVHLIPRWGQYANDASYEDVIELVREPLFEDLKNLYRKRFMIIKYGPPGSGMNAHEFSMRVFKALRASDVVLFKGSRAFEMMQGIRKPAYFGFSVLHSFTETLTGLDASECPGVFLKQEPGLSSFEDFRARAWRKHQFPSGRIVGLAKKTAYEHYLKYG